MLSLKQILTLHCREASRLASEELDRQLSVSERVGMWAHLGICVGCRRMRSQVRLVQRWVEHLYSREGLSDASTTTRLSVARRQQIKKLLRRCGP